MPLPRPLSLNLSEAERAELEKLVERIGDGRDEKVAGLDGLDGYKVDAVSKVVCDLGASLNSQPGFANPTGADEGQQLAGGVSQQGDDLVYFFNPTDERGKLRG